MDPALLIIIVFILAPLIERILKAGKQPPAPPDQQQRRPDVQLPQQRRPQPSSRDEDESAADMLPDDLWEILTGERRAPPARPAPQPGTSQPRRAEPEPRTYDEEPSHEYEPQPWAEPEYETYEPEYEPEYVEEAPEEVTIAYPVPYERPLPERPPPKIVSLEETSFDYEVRHDRYHDRLNTLGVPAHVNRRPLSAHAAESISGDDLRRAIIMAEILGPPKGLQSGLGVPKGLE